MIVAAATSTKVRHADFLHITENLADASLPLPHLSSLAPLHNLTLQFIDVHQQRRDEGEGGNLMVKK
jgi:hypothetical protein